MDDLNDKPYPIYKVLLVYLVLGSPIGALIAFLIFLFSNVDNIKFIDIEAIGIFITVGYMIGFIPSLCVAIKMARNKSFIDDFYMSDLFVLGLSISLKFAVFSLISIMLFNMITDWDKFHFSEFLSALPFFTFLTTLYSFIGGLSSVIVGCLILPKR